MLDIHRAHHLMRALTGLHRKAFDELLVAFTASLQAARLAKPRQRAPGGGKKAQLSGDQEKLFYILFYFKCYPTCDVAGFLFDFDRSQANRWMHRLQAILELIYKQLCCVIKNRDKSILNSVEIKHQLHSYQA